MYMYLADPALCVIAIQSPYNQRSFLLSPQIATMQEGELPFSKRTLSCVWHDYCGLGGRLFAEATREPHSSSSLLQSSRCTKHSMKHNLAPQTKLLESLTGTQ